jgi:glycine cleavage system aminomethyltransferase T
MHADLGATMELEAGWEFVRHHGDERAERAILGETVAVVDVTARAKVDVRGGLDGALSVAGDALIARIAQDWALVLGEPGGEEVLLPKMEQAAGPASMVTDATHLFAGVALSGPMLLDAVARLTSWDAASLPRGEATGAPIADIRAVVVRRDLDVEVLEVFVATEFARYAWETILDAVGRVGGGPAGWRALRAEGWS